MSPGGGHIPGSWRPARNARPSWPLHSAKAGLFDQFGQQGVAVLARLLGGSLLAKIRPVVGPEHVQGSGRLITTVLPPRPSRPRSDAANHVEALGKVGRDALHVGVAQLLDRRTQAGLASAAFMRTFSKMEAVLYSSKTACMKSADAEKSPLALSGPEPPAKGRGILLFAAGGRHRFGVVLGEVAPLLQP